MGDVTNLTPGHSEVERLDGINDAISDLMTLSDLLGMANNEEISESDGETVKHAASMMYDRAAKLQRLMA